MKKILHYYSLSPEWMPQLAEQTGGEMIADKIIIFPEKIGNGHCYFTQVTPNISVVFMDVFLNTPLKIHRQRSDYELYIFHFDLSEHVNLIKINNQNYEIGSYDKLDLAIIDNQIESTYKPALKERTFALRILVDKKMLADFITKYPEIKYKGSLNEKIDDEVFYHYGNIDSNSVLLLQSLKTKSIHDLSFEPFLKGITLKLLGNFFSKFYDIGETKNNLTQAESDAINKTKKYMLSNLYSPFPSVTFLASMAGMSESKYKMAFKENTDTTPNNFFIREKMNLGRELLKSGEYYSLTEVMYELSYSKLSYFSSKYFELFNHKPMDDFVKKAN
ncbi:helix-turn-helix domain-containing protein [Flavobacterium phragmitis]|uniref:AraC-type DNA-binding protein n=1 Tax=Flavobacterium phragmitis TaxID=739143 RepID=A0A1I1T4V4_9FLAO|nr:AraC family transcriptional regulator [Flavobacterium phragmitis]SFD53651.1 AraC-type DNA-binding protein [Flavobacterium phragmitis]